MRDAWRHFIAEFIGTFALVFVGGAAIIHARTTEQPGGLVEIALAHGLILAVMVSALMRISGHFNPAVTLTLLATRRIEAMMAGVYIVAQIIGAVVAAYALKAAFPGRHVSRRRGAVGSTIALDVTAGRRSCSRRSRPSSSSSSSSERRSIRRRRRSAGSRSDSWSPRTFSRSGRSPARR